MRTPPRHLPTDPFEFTLGENKVIKGWEVAVLTMRIGERAQLTCAAAYDYGDAGSEDDVAPGATLVFDIELVGTKNVVGAGRDGAATEVERLAALRAERAELAAKKEAEKEAKEAAKAEAQAKLQVCTGRRRGTRASRRAERRPPPLPPLRWALSRARARIRVSSFSFRAWSVASFAPPGRAGVPSSLPPRTASTASTGSACVCGARLTGGGDATRGARARAQAKLAAKGQKGKGGGKGKKK